MTRPLRNGLLLLGSILVVTFCTIYFTVDLSTWRAFSYFSVQNIMAALLVLAVGMYFDGRRLQRLVAMNGYRVGMTGILQVIFGNYFLGLLTPGASGGAVAQVMILRSIGVPVAKSTMIVIIRTVFSILFLVFAMPIVFYYDNMDIPYIGHDSLFCIASLFVLCCIVGFWLFTGVWGKTLAYRLMKMFRVKSCRIRKMIRFLSDLQDTLRILAQHPRDTLLVFIESGISLCMIYSILPALLWNAEPSGSYAILLGRMIVLNFMLYFAPTPGGTGVAEGFFVLLFKNYVPSGSVGILAVMWRALAEYLPFFIGMYFVLTIFGKKYLLHSDAESNSNRS